MAQKIGFIAHEYGYTLAEIGELSVFQLEFLVDWLRWASKQRRPE